MQIKDFIEVRTLLEKYPTSSLFFFRDAEDVSNVELLSALMRIPEVPRELAIETWRSVKPVPHRVLAGDIKDFLALFTLMQRKAMIFGMETGLTLEEVVLLKWKKAREMKVSDTARLILRSMPRHLFMEFAFWEYGNSADARPLMTLVADFNRNSAMSWEQIRALYLNSIMVDSESDVHELERLISSLS